MSAMPGLDGDAAHTRIRSFTRRSGRLKPRQERAWESREGVVLDVPMVSATAVSSFARLDLDHVLGPAPSAGSRLVVEIGCGAGEQIAHAARRHPEDRFLGLEVWLPGLARTVARVREVGADNVHLLGVDAEQALPLLLAPGTVDELWTFFPDPWRKPRHRKRRLVSPDFAAVVAELLAPGGTWRLATDWPNYADQMVAVLSGEPALELTVEPDRWEGRTLTRFERRGQDEGRPITDLTAVRRRG